jgi:prepilin-type N-terminal cleavage/methylation domain-containing protein/prepilin-type processing-associated H-X9-DG protein
MALFVAMPNRSPADQQMLSAFPRTAGFTIVELLVVIGVIGVLISILIPTISRARVHSNRAACLANLREIGVLAQTWASSHSGWLPLDGKVATPDSLKLPAALADNARRKYSYTLDDGSYLLSNNPPTKESPTPFLVAILFANELITPTSNWSERVDPLYPRTKTMQCPAISERSSRWAMMDQKGVASLVLRVGSSEERFSPWFTSFDFSTNGYLLGFDVEGKKLRGNTAKARYPAETVVVGDSNAPFLSWNPIDLQGKVSMSDVLMNRPSMDTSLTGLNALDTVRHRDVINLLFADWHAASMAATEKGLSQSYLVR